MDRLTVMIVQTGKTSLDLTRMSDFEIFPHLDTVAVAGVYSCTLDHPGLCTHCDSSSLRLFSLSNCSLLLFLFWSSRLQSSFVRDRITGLTRFQISTFGPLCFALILVLS